MVLKVSRADLRLLVQAGVLIGEFKIKAVGLPVVAQEVFELRVLLGCDYSIESGVDERLEVHTRPSDRSWHVTQSWRRWCSISRLRNNVR